MTDTCISWVATLELASLWTTCSNMLVSSVALPANHCRRNTERAAMLRDQLITRMDAQCDQVSTKGYSKSSLSHV